MVNFIIFISIIICLLVSAAAFYVTKKSYERKYYDED